MCLIFIWLEFLQDNIVMALGHLASGLRILSEQPSPFCYESLGRQLAHLFALTHTQATLRGSATSDFKSNSVYYPVDLEPAPLAFRDVSEARHSLDERVNSIFRFHRQIEQPGYADKQQHAHPFPDPLSLESTCELHFQS